MSQGLVHNIFDIKNDRFRSFIGHLSILTVVGSSQRALGLRSGKIPNKYITASTTWNRYHAPWLARLNKRYKRPYSTAWCAKVNNKHQWLQVYLGQPKKVNGIATQGRRDASQWVVRYYITYSIDGVHYVPYKCKKVRTYYHYHYIH
jgi:hypothetical protein